MINTTSYSLFPEIFCFFTKGILIAIAIFVLFQQSISLSLGLLETWWDGHMTRV
jgi:predicted membrane-bound dolichyl-phosphate-mannose-protein mannosyltransferase